MKQPKDTPDEKQIANDISTALPPTGSLAGRMTALQKAADEIGPVDRSFDLKSFFDTLLEPLHSRFNFSAPIKFNAKPSATVE